MPGRDREIERNPSSGRRVMRDIVGIGKPSRSFEPPPVGPRPPKEIKKKPARRFKFTLPSRQTLYIGGGVVLILAAAIVLLNIFSSVHLVITPRQESVELDSVLRSSVSSNQDVALETITIEDSLELSEKVNAVKKVEEKAKGQVVIFNAFSAEPQLLVAGTRLEAPNGNIYRISNPVTVPGARAENGKLVPEGIEVTVFADKPGPEYNLGLSDFTIPGFKGSPRFEKFYARSKTEISGGFSGTSKVVSKEDVELLMKRAEDTFRANLIEEVEKDLPSGVFVPEKAVEIKITLDEVDPPVNSAGETLRIKVKGTASAFALKKSDMAKSLGKSYLSLQGSEEVEISNLDDLSFEVLSKDFEGKMITVKVKGRAKFVWLFDEEALKGDLIKASKRARRGVFGNYPAIDRAEINFNPVWWRFFPNEAGGIRLERVIEEKP